MSHLAQANTKTQPDATEGDINMSPARDAYMQRPLGEMTRRLLERDAAAFLHQSLSTPCMNTLAGARGDLLIDTDGVNCSTSTATAPTRSVMRTPGSSRR